MNHLRTSPLGCTVDDGKSPVGGGFLVDVSDASERMTDSLREAKELYEQTDQAIAALFPDPSTGAAPADPGSSPISRALNGGAPR